jgi:hypothetical protein
MHLKLRLLRSFFFSEACDANPELVFSHSNFPDGNHCFCQEVKKQFAIVQHKEITPIFSSFFEKLN